MASGTGRCRSESKNHVSGERNPILKSLKSPAIIWEWNFLFSLPFGVVKISKRFARSAGDFAIGPTVSNEWDRGIKPSCGTRFIVGRRVYNAARVLGVIKDPPVSVPIARGEYPALTPTAEPVDEPEGDYRCLPALVSTVGRQVCHLLDTYHLG